MSRAGVTLTASCSGALVLCAFACGSDHASAPPTTMPAVAASAHESTDPRPGVPATIEREAGADAAAEAAAPIVLLPDAGGQGAVTNGSDVVAAQRAKLRACYTRAPADRRNKGRLVIHLDIDGTGAVLAVSAPQNEGYSAGLVACLSDALKGARYSVTPAGSHAVLDLPLASRDITK